MLSGLGVQVIFRVLGSIPGSRLTELGCTIDAVYLKYSGAQRQQSRLKGGSLPYIKTA